MTHILDRKSQSSKDDKSKNDLTELKISKELFEIITTWDNLPGLVKNGILAMIRSIKEEKHA